MKNKKCDRCGTEIVSKSTYIITTVQSPDGILPASGDIVCEQCYSEWGRKVHEVNEPSK